MPTEHVHTNGRFTRKRTHFRAGIKYIRVAANKDKKWDEDCVGRIMQHSSPSRCPLPNPRTCRSVLLPTEEQGELKVQMESHPNQQIGRSSWIIQVLSVTTKVPKNGRGRSDSQRKMGLFKRDGSVRQMRPEVAAYEVRERDHELRKVGSFWKRQEKSFSLKQIFSRREGTCHHLHLFPLRFESGWCTELSNNTFVLV